MTPPATQNNLPTEPPTLSVSQLNRQVKRLLEGHFDFIWIEGEISNLATPASGHWYFSLKDDAAQVRCAMFRNRNQRVRFKPENGQLVRLRARVSLYEGRGEFQLIGEHLEDAGAGALQRAFEALKAKLHAEGLFDSERKRSLPNFPQHVAIITSRSGAALRDILTVFKRRYPGLRLSLIPSSVQGAEAPGQLLEALATAYEHGGFDAIVLARGGGSAEDLWAFNNEALARMIAASPIPLISAVGHETDFTIADFVADQRAPTPSAAAEMLSPDQNELANQLLNIELTLARQFRRQLKYLFSLVAAASAGLRHPGDRLREQAQRLDELELGLQRAVTKQNTARRHRLEVAQRRLLACHPGSDLQAQQRRLADLDRRARRATGHNLGQARQRLQLQRSRLESLGPQRTLDRGYAIVRDASGALVKDGAALQKGQTLTTRLAKGSFSSDVTAVDD